LPHPVKLLENQLAARLRARRERPIS
jgi:hypothetical protein